jgi:hypothetical protein
MTLFTLTTYIELGLFWSQFLMTLLALLIFLYLANSDIPGMMGLKTL